MRRRLASALADAKIEANHFDTASLLIRRAKIDPEGAGRIAHLTAGALHALYQWKDAAQIEEGPLFRRSMGGSPFTAS